MENTKKCTKCGKELPLDQFYRRKLKDGKVGYRPECKYCKKIANAAWRQSNPGYIAEWYENNPNYHTEWRDKNIDRERVRRDKWSKSNPDKARESCVKWRRDHPEENRESINRWRKANYDRYKKTSNIRRKERRNTDINYRIKCRLRSAISNSLINGTKRDHAIELLGCSIIELRDYLEAHFQSGMTWGNYGRNGWHIDHIIPLSYFNLADPGQQRRAWHYTNLQPLWAADNIKKSNNIEERQLVLL